jgi:hypothetical protein
MAARRASAVKHALEYEGNTTLEICGNYRVCRYLY